MAEARAQFPQPDLPATSEALRVIATNLPLMANHPALVNTEESEARLDARFNRLTETITAGFRELNERLDRLERRLDGLEASTGAEYVRNLVHVDRR
jgi:hypothetical protein